ncbi:MAG: hypothetical protein O7J95_20010 [Planctomycetota bacterium]|nr:hypothetical protein [Planctomycetota bacterium]
MKRLSRSSCLLAGLLATTMATATTLATATESGLRENQRVPLVQLPALSRSDAAPTKLRSLADFRGKKVLLHIFASW